MSCRPGYTEVVGYFHDAQALALTQKHQDLQCLVDGCHSAFGLSGHPIIVTDRSGSA
jgi:hypothetical protein